MIKKILLAASLSSLLLGDIVTQDQIDPNKKVIQIASFKTLDDSKKSMKSFKYVHDKNIFLRNYKNKYYIIYAVNINAGELKSTLKELKKDSPSAFVTKQLSIYLNSLETKKTKSMFKTLDQKIKSKPKEESKQDRFASVAITDTEDLYQQAVYAYNQKDYKDAYKYFAQYAQKNSMDKRANFFYARSAFESGYYNEALSIYDKILLQDPNNPRVQLEIGQCYFRLQDYTKAKNSFNNILQNKLPENVRKNVIAMLNAIESKEIKSVTQIMLMIAHQYDSNVDNSSNAFSLPTLTLQSNGAKTTDRSTQLVVSLNNRYKLQEDSAIESKAVALTQKYVHQDQKNVDMLALESAFSKYKKDSKLALGLGYSHIWLDGSSYMNIPSLTLNYDKTLDSNLSYQGYFKVLTKNYLQNANNDKDSKGFEIYNSLILNTKDYGTNIAGFTLGKDIRSRGIRTDVNQNNYRFTIANNYPVSQSLLLKSSLEYEISKYRNEDIVFGTKRVDKQLSASLGVIKSLNKSLSLGTNIQWIDNNSNHAPFEYDKYIIKGFVYYGF